ncbi:sensor histidine kinase [Anaeromyxobacter oryzae]|uniref:Signal transduction histidine-protein kinase/phosphatase MprB n=1 Tax=Anaeromyxobacter oryzae TaxID=2918170 RepID=A0ABM7WS24_9BACT|nr:HAMP domain-containing sensor histidine kinase [Anaeromyxobacter oryzae]BDG02264.1 hypothetical protein AMOR_12600 [Anaeromyxobacter oryzae]
MTRSRLGPYRITLRIYVVTAAAVLGTGAALFLALSLARERREPPANPLFRDVARYAAGRVAAAWPSEPAIRAQLAALAADLPFDATVDRWDGALVAATGARPAEPLSPAERDALARDGLLQRGEGCSHRRPCPVALPVVSGGAPVGYLVLEVDPRRPPGGVRPPPELLGLAVLLVALGIAAALLGSSIAAPLDRLARTAHALGSGDLGARTGLRRRDELGDVARAFDEMADGMVGLIRSQTELIANVAHELRTPLARIRVALDLAADGDAAVARESLAEIGEDLAELEGLVNDVLATARMDLAANTATGGTPPMRRAALDVAEVVGAATERLRHRYPDRRVEVELEPGLPAIDGDAVLLRRAIDNLLDNARKYSPPGSELRVRALRRGEEVAIEVVDRGEGIAAEDLDRIFTPFFRADRSRARATGGVGLGLPLARRIAEAHGGTLVARSAPGAGTTMTVTLPAAPSALHSSG